MTDADLEHFAQLVGGSVDYYNAHEVIVRMRKGCKLYLRLNAKTPYGCHLALSAEKLGAGVPAVRAKVQAGLKGWCANGRLDVDYNPRNRSTKFGNAVRFTPTANPSILLSDSVYYIAVLALEVLEQLGNLGVL